MNPITIPANLVPAFGGPEPARVCDESAKVLGYYTPVREATEANYEWALSQITEEEIEASRRVSIRTGDGFGTHGRQAYRRIADMNRITPSGNSS